MKKDESIKFRMIGHDKTIYKAIELDGFADSCFIFKVYWKHVDDYGLFWIPMERIETFSDILDQLFDIISESLPYRESQESELTQPQTAQTLPLLFC